MRSPNNPDQPESLPVGQINYFNVLAQSIQHINDAIMNDKDPRDAAENLLTDLPDDWTKEVQETIDKAGDEYNKVLTDQNPIINSHAKESIKEIAREKIRSSGKKYSRSVKKIVISLLKNKNLLYSTRKPIEQGFYLKDDENDD